MYYQLPLVNDRTARPLLTNRRRHEPRQCQWSSSIKLACVIASVVRRFWQPENSWSCGRHQIACNPLTLWFWHIEHISLKPNRESRRLFSGVVWIDPIFTPSRLGIFLTHRRWVPIFASPPYLGATPVKFVISTLWSHVIKPSLITSICSRQLVRLHGW